MYLSMYTSDIDIQHLMWLLTDCLGDRVQQLKTGNILLYLNRSSFLKVCLPSSVPCQAKFTQKTTKTQTIEGDKDAQYYQKMFLKRKKNAVEIDIFNWSHIRETWEIKQLCLNKLDHHIGGLVPGSIYPLFHIVATFKPTSSLGNLMFMKLDHVALA